MVLHGSGAGDGRSGGHSNQRLIDKGTEAFLKKLQARDCLASHLGKHDENTPPTAFSDEKNSQPPITDASALAAKGDDRCQDLVIHSNPYVSLSFHAEQQSQPVSTVNTIDSSQAISCRPNRGREAPRWNVRARQLKKHQDEQVQFKAQNGHEFSALPGVRLSVDTFGDWNPFSQNDDVQPQRENGPELEQNTMTKWQPRGDSQDLPDSVASSLCFSDSGHYSLSKGGFIGSNDIRNEVAGESDLVPRVHSEGFYNKNSWDEYPNDTKSLEQVWRPTYCQLWVKQLEGRDWPVAVFLKLEDRRHELCDVQTTNGWLLPPIEYPDTYIDSKDATIQDAGSMARRLSRSANLMIKANYQKLKRRVELREVDVQWDMEEGPFIDVYAEQSVKQHIHPDVPRRDDQTTKNEMKMKPQQPDDRAIPVFQQLVEHRGIDSTHQTTQNEEGLKWHREEDPFPIIPQAEQPVNEPAHQLGGHRPDYSMRPGPIIHRPAYVVHDPVFGRITHLPRSYEYEAPPTYLKMACFLRPAEYDDISQLMHIYNWEVTNGLQALDTKKLDHHDMQRVLDTCWSARTPIIVAVAGTASEAVARRHSSLSLSDGQGEKDVVIGFAFIGIPTTGLSGQTWSNVGRFEGQVHIYVSDECRRKGVGRALLQRIKIFSSRYAGRYAQEYEWYGPTSRDPNGWSRVYDEAVYNSRSYSRIFIHMTSRAMDDPATLWMSSFLESENFQLVSIKDKSRKIGYGQDGELADCLIWQHECQNLDTMKENHRSNEWKVTDRKASDRTANERKPMYRR